MIRAYLRNFFAAISAIFWADKSKFLMGIWAIFFAIQHVACAYGTDEGGDFENPLVCKPFFDIEKISRENYLDCENSL